MSKAKTVSVKKARLLDSREHHCSQCNRPKIHEVFEYEDGVLMKCPCGYEFVDIIAFTTAVEVRETETEDDSDKS